jgi:hypothetical protein
MRIRNAVNGYEYEAELCTFHSASSYGQAVLVDKSTGEAVDRFSFGVSEVLEATEEELAGLKKAGYFAGGTP